MNIWECQEVSCHRRCVGTGGAVGLRAIGWYVRMGPVIFCPEHRPDAGEDDCSHCLAEVWSFTFQHLIDSKMAHPPVLAMEHGHQVTP